MKFILQYLTLLVVQILEERIGNMGMGNDLLDLGEISKVTWIFRRGWRRSRAALGEVEALVWRLDGMDLCEAVMIGS